jgi:hypothetical protein
MIAGAQIPGRLGPLKQGPVFAIKAPESTDLNERRITADFPSRSRHGISAVRSANANDVSSLPAMRFSEIIVVRQSLER